MSTLLLFKPCCHPSNNIRPDSGVPIIPPTLCRSLNLHSRLAEDSKIGLVNYLYRYLFVKEAVIVGDQIMVKVNVEKNYQVLNATDLLFKEGLHTLSNKIWRVSRNIELLTNGEADFYINKNLINYFKKYCCCDSRYDYLVYVIDMA